MEGNNLSCASSEVIYIDENIIMDTGTDTNPPRLGELAQ